MLYKALEDWGYDGFVMADDTGSSQVFLHMYTQINLEANQGIGIIQLETVHQVAKSPLDAIEQWLNAGGMLQFYDYPLEMYINVLYLHLYHVYPFLIPLKLNTGDQTLNF